MSKILMGGEKSIFHSWFSPNFFKIFQVLKEQAEKTLSRCPKQDLKSTVSPSVDPSGKVGTVVRSSS